MSTFEIYFMWTAILLILGIIGLGLVGILANVEKIRKLLSTFVLNNDIKLNPTKSGK